MPERNKKINAILLQSSLFKGRSDWYFCYLKTERIAHVMVMLGQRVPINDLFEDLVKNISLLPSTFVQFAAGQVDKAVVLADIVSAVSRLRLAVAEHLLNAENGAILTQELEQIVERLASEHHPSPFVSAEDLAVPSLIEAATHVLPQKPPFPIKDISKGHDSKGQLQLSSNDREANERADRSIKILQFIRSSPRAVSIKDIGKTVSGVSEKTIQRELGELIGQGLIKKEGERRWSVYRPV